MKYLPKIGIIRLGCCRASGGKRICAFSIQVLIPAQILCRQSHHYNDEAEDDEDDEDDNQNHDYVGHNDFSSV